MPRATFDPQTWQPIRLPVKAESRNADFPPLDTFQSREYDDMTGWCEKHCRGGFLPVPDTDRSKPTIFWFELTGDATNFALNWFPFKCL
jgi:hypothetical protein